MPTMLQLNPTIPLDSPKGPCRAFLVLDYGEDHALYYSTFVDATGENWTWPAEKVRLRKNISFGIRVE